MANLSTSEKHLLEKLFQMSSGFVLNFTNLTIEEFFRDDIGVDIYDKKYNYRSGSKANRIRGFWLYANDKLVGKSILKLIEYIENQISLGFLNSNDFKKNLINDGIKIGQKLFQSNTKIKNRSEINFIRLTKFGDELISMINERNINKINNYKDYYTKERNYIVSNFVNYPEFLKNCRTYDSLIIYLNYYFEDYSSFVTYINDEFSNFLNVIEFGNVSDNNIIISDTKSCNDTLSIVLQKEVFDHVKTLLNSGHYFNAVEESYKIVRAKLKSITGKEKAHEAFKEDNYEILFGHKPFDEAEKDFFEGVKFLHMAIQNLRNEKSHSPAKELEKNLAIHYIVLASLAYSLINKNQ